MMASIYCGLGYNAFRVHFPIEIFRQPCEGVLLLSPVLQMGRLRHRKGVCRVYTCLVGREKRGKELRQSLEVVHCGGPQTPIRSLEWGYGQWAGAVGGTRVGAGRGGGELPWSTSGTKACGKGRVWGQRA